MIQENSFDETDPKNKKDEETYLETESEAEEDTEGYDILPSNGPGLTGDDGEQVVDDGEEEEDKEDDK